MNTVKQNFSIWDGMLWNMRRNINTEMFLHSNVLSISGLSFHLSDCKAAFSFDFRRHRTAVDDDEDRLGLELTSPRIISSDIPPIPFSWIMNKIIIVCSMKFLLHFPLLMIILFKYISWKIYSVIWMPMISPNMCGEKHNIVSSYCFFISGNAAAVSVQRLEIVWNVQLGSPWTCEYDLYGVRIDFDSVCMSDHCFLINKCVR